MAYRVVYHDKAEAELDKLYEDITVHAGLVIAGDFVEGLINFIESLITFPERGTIRESKVPGLRIIGYRRSVSIAFVVEGPDIKILGVFQRGQNITPEMLEARQ